jgi:hypothetical protein
MRTLKIGLLYIGKPEEFQYNNFTVIRTARTSGHDKESYYFVRCNSIPPFHPVNTLWFNPRRKSVLLQNVSNVRARLFTIKASL